ACVLVAEIPREMNNFDAWILPRPLRDERQGSITAAVVHQQHFRPARELVHKALERFAQMRDHGLLVIHRNHEREFRRVRPRLQDVISLLWFWHSELTPVSYSCEVPRNVLYEPGCT